MGKRERAKELQIDEEVGDTARLPTTMGESEARRWKGRSDEGEGYGMVGKV